MKRNGKLFLVLGTLAIVLTCHSALWAANDDDREATVWTMTNDPNGNAVLAFRLADGKLIPMESVSTGGTGTGGREPDFGLLNAHALQLSDDGKLMFVVKPWQQRYFRFCGQRYHPDPAGSRAFRRTTAVERNRAWRPGLYTECRRQRWGS